MFWKLYCEEFDALFSILSLTKHCLFPLPFLGVKVMYLNGRLEIDQYITRMFLQPQFDIREEEENAARNRCEEQRILRLLEMTWRILVGLD